MNQRKQKLDQQAGKQIKKDMEQQQQKQEDLEKVLNQECSVVLLRREVITIHNILASLQYKLGDAELVLEILKKLTPHAAVDTNITEESHEQQVEEALVLGKKEAN